MTDSIQADLVRISGFRGIKNLEMSLPRVAVLIGANNTGKTSLLKALQLALGDYARYISEEDFYIGADEKRVNEINVDVRFVPVNQEGERVSIFDNGWLTEFGDKIKAEPNGSQYVALRTRVRPNEIKGGFECIRYVLQTWPIFDEWLNEKVKEKDKISRALGGIALISVDAQRDIHYELKDKTSFAGKVLSGIEYASDDIIEIEGLIESINQSAIDKSSILKDFKAHLEQLNQSFHGAGNIEITPFPKKIRDLSKHFSIHFGENANGVFSMEYHGMGTRSWASMLTVKAFIEVMAGKHEQEVEPFYPILAAEEPEAHLHPNAQKTLYHQLAQTKGQVIVSTHSPYFAAMADIADIRALRKDLGGISTRDLVGISREDKKILAREITLKRGEILFARALILCEGVTEEQVIPAMFDIFIKKSLFSLGTCCIGVGGKNYTPYLKLACSIGIPTYVVSDNDSATQKEVEAQLRRLRKDMPAALSSNVFGISYFKAGNDFEAELFTEINLKDEIIRALVLSETKASENSRYVARKLKEIKLLSNTELLNKMRSSKASYAGYLADVIRENPNNKDPADIIPLAVKDAFNKIKEWYAL